jgi:hypothetical protein
VEVTLNLPKSRIAIDRSDAATAVMAVKIVATTLRASVFDSPCSAET